jgi:predicted  nucleic acid-binding Zn-ribbon protein
MITCRKCGTTFATGARSSSTRCKGCGVAVYVPASVREANGGEASSAQSAGPVRSVPRDGSTQVDGDVAILVFGAAGVVWIACRVRKWWRARRHEPPPAPVPD